MDASTCFTTCNIATCQFFNKTNAVEKHQNIVYIDVVLKKNEAAGKYLNGILTLYL